MLAATAVAPGHSKVVPLSPEFIVKQDGAEKQDCERNAVKRWLDQHGARLKPLRPVYLADDLFACQSVVKRLAANGDDFIFTCKETSHKALYNFIEGCAFERHEIKVRKGKMHETHRYRFIENVPLRDGKDAVLVNWIGFEILDAKGAVKYKTALVTSLPVTKASVAEIVVCGRARWKIENESFNVLKNHGYELEHNFGHGETYLAMTLAALNLLAFAWHTVLDLVEPPWRKAREAAEKRTSFFAYLVTLTSFVVFPAWPTSSKPSPPSRSRPTYSLSKKTNKGMPTKPRATFRIAGSSRSAFRSSVSSPTVRSLRSMVGKRKPRRTRKRFAGCGLRRQASQKTSTLESGLAFVSPMAAVYSSSIWTRTPRIRRRSALRRCALLSPVCPRPRSCGRRARAETGPLISIIPAPKARKSAIAPSCWPAFPVWMCAGLAAMSSVLAR